MNTLHALASKVARKVARHESGSRLLARLNARPRIIMLHGVGTDEYPTDVFRTQLQFLSRIFQLVPLASILQVDAADQSRPALALTFDDGLKNNFTAAYPVLREFNAPATFFVCPALIDNGQWLWNHECRARLSRMQDDAIRGFAAELGIQRFDTESIVQQLKYLPHAERKVFEIRLRTLSGPLSPSAAERLAYDLMSWEDLKALDPTLISIGGHSCNHEILTRLDPEHLEREVAECKSRLEREIDAPVTQFCYPDGAYNARVAECVGRHFELAVTTEKHCVPRNPSPLQLPRIATAENLADLAWRVHWPNG